MQLKTRHKLKRFPFQKASLPRYLTQEEVKRLFAVIPSSRDRALFALIYHYGLRVEEATLLTLERGKRHVCRSLGVSCDSKRRPTGRARSGTTRADDTQPPPPLLPTAYRPL